MVWSKTIVLDATQEAEAGSLEPRGFKASLGNTARLLSPGWKRGQGVEPFASRCEAVDLVLRTERREEKEWKGREGGEERGGVKERGGERERKSLNY